jgi:hypothetical protein
MYVRFDIGDMKIKYSHVVCVTIDGVWIGE